MMRRTLKLAMRTWIESDERGPQRASRHLTLTRGYDMSARAVTNALYILTALAGYAATASAADGVWTLGMSGGTQGAGPELAYRAGKYLGLRANAGYFS